MSWFERLAWAIRMAVEDVPYVRGRLRFLHDCNEAKDTPLFGWAGPMRRYMQQCCRCGRFRIFGKFCEVFPSGSGVWYFGCLECCLDMASNSLGQARALAGTGGDEEW